MRRSGGHSWQVSIGHSQAVTIALYLREVAGLRGRVSPPLLPLDPPVPQTASGVDLEAASREWEQWWQTRDVARSAHEWERWWAAFERDHGRSGGDLRMDAPDVRWRDQLLVPEPPDYPGFEAWPTLRALLARHLEDATRWSTAQNDAHADRMTAANGGPGVDIGRLVRHVERQLRRRASPFVLHITEVPVAGADGWIVSDQDVIVSKGLLADQDATAAFLTPVLRSLALGPAA